MGQWNCVIADILDVEQHRAGDVALGEFGFRVAPGAGQMKAGVEYLDVRIAEMFGKPSGFGQGVGICITDREISLKNALGVVEDDVDATVAFSFVFDLADSDWPDLAGAR